MYKILRILRSRQKFTNNFKHLKHIEICGAHKYIIVRTLKHHAYRQCSSENKIFNTSLLVRESLERTKYMLLTDNKDALINQLNSCSCIEDVWNILRRHKNDLSESQLTQTILILKELQNEYSAINVSKDNASLLFQENLKQSSDFSAVINMVVCKLDNFNSDLLSYIFLYLNKLGLHSDDYPMPLIAEKLQKSLLEDFNIYICSRWIKVIFQEGGIRPYFLALQFIPTIFHLLDKSDSFEHFEALTICLIRLENMVTTSILEKYKEKVENFLTKKELSGGNHNTILKIIIFLSKPSWRDQNVKLISKCISSLKNELNQLDAPHFLLLYDVFFKTQEPGDLLNEIQRSAAKFWQQFEESGNLDTNTALKIFLSLIYFNSPLQRIQLRRNITKLIKNKMEPEQLIQLRKIFSFVKISDKTLCHQYWYLWRRLLREDKSINLLIKACYNYMQFNIDIDNYRNNMFEKQAIEQIAVIVENNSLIFPSDLTVLLIFVTLYGKDQLLLQLLLEKFKSNPKQLRAYDCFLLSRIFTNESNNCTPKQEIEIKQVLNDASQHLMSLNSNRFETNALLIKAAIFRREHNSYEIDNLITEFKEMDYMSSKFLENISYIFLNTNTLIPEVFNKMTEYVINNCSNIIGFNAEKLLFLSFYLAYIPINAEKFFRTVTDIIIRDQERLSGLAFLQSALALSYFNKLPSFLVKQIFNVEFMDRLDTELANCYSKEKYPLRVRQTLMQLNRAVCLEYPEFNVPWFHEKYVQENQKRYSTEIDYNVVESIKEYLVEIAGNHILDNFTTPYGYHIDFILHLNKEDNIVPINSKSISKRIALLLVRHYAFTRLYTHLKGTYQMKIRHLEIMGYNVSILKFDEWSNLLYASERIEYLKRLIWPKTWKTAQSVIQR